jgi:hypothetical protein
MTYHAVNFHVKEVKSKILHVCKNGCNGCDIMMTQLLNSLAFIDVGYRREALVGKYMCVCVCLCREIISGKSVLRVIC